MANQFKVVNDLTVAGATSLLGALTMASSSTRTVSPTTATEVRNAVAASTTDATATTVATLPVPASGCVTVEVLVQGIQSGGSNGFEQKCVNSARRNGAAAPTLSQGATGVITGALENTFAIVKPSFLFRMPRARCTSARDRDGSCNVAAMKKAAVLLFALLLSACPKPAPTCAPSSPDAGTALDSPCSGKADGVPCCLGAKAGKCMSSRCDAP